MPTTTATIEVNTSRVVSNATEIYDEDRNFDPSNLIVMDH